jgi:hypothetical protein
VDTKYFAIDNGSQCEEIEDLTTSFPYRRIAVLGLTFLVEAVDLGDLPRLVVSTDKGDSVRESIMLNLPSMNSEIVRLTLPSST